MSRRNRNTAAFSLFSFQDIVTSVTGIMILVTLILAIELIQRVAGDPQRQTEEIVEEMSVASAEAERLRKSIQENERAIEEFLGKLAERQRRLEELSTVDVQAMQRQLEELQRTNERLEKEISELELQRQAARRREEQAARDEKSLAEKREKLRKTKQELTEAQRGLDRLKKSNRRIFVRSKGDSKSPWLVEIDAQGFRVAEVGKRQRPLSFPGTSEFLRWAGNRSRGSEYFVLLVKPDAVETFHQIREELRGKGFDVGSDLLAQSEAAIDAEMGAAFE